jgi:hypothetical protein
MTMPSKAEASAVPGVSEAPPSHLGLFGVVFFGVSVLACDGNNRSQTDGRLSVLEGAFARPNEAPYRGSRSRIA